MRRLGANHWKLGAGLRLLSGWPRLAQIEELDLSYNQLSAEGLAALARSPHVARLAVLDLTGNGLSEAELGVLADAPWFDQVRTLRR